MAHFIGHLFGFFWQTAIWFLSFNLIFLSSAIFFHLNRTAPITKAVAIVVAAVIGSNGSSGVSVEF